MKKLPVISKKYPNLELAEKAALIKMESFETGGILNEYKNQEGVLIGYKVIPPIDTEEKKVVIYKYVPDVL